MQPPITIDDHGDLSIFERLEDAEKYVEPIDVSRGDLVAYDSEGRLLRGRIVKTWLFGLGRGVKLELAEDAPQHVLALRQSLIEFLVELGEPGDVLETESLPELIAKGITRLRPRTKKKD